MRIDIVDMTDPKFIMDVNYIKKNDAGSSIIKLHGMSNGVAQMVNFITNIATAESIEILRIWGHGFPGGQIISSGGSADDILNHYSGLEVSDLDSSMQYINKLKGLFTNNARVELRGCSVGLGTRGENFLRSLAQIWRVPVRAGLTARFIGKDWQGTVVEAQPDGTLRCNN